LQCLGIFKTKTELDKIFLLKSEIEEFLYHVCSVSSLINKVCVTNSTASSRFLVAGGFTSLLLIFAHRTGAVQN
jgi:hypothetical protein